MCGYSTEDFLTYLKEDSRINIVQEDIPYVMNTAMKALENNISINVVYRIYTKDRQQIMIRLDGTVMSDVTFKEDDIAIIYAVHTRVSNDAIEMMQEQKRYRMLLDNLDISYFEWDIEKSIGAGMNEHLSKPIDDKKICEVIKKYCN